MKADPSLHDAYEQVTGWWLQHPLYDPAGIFVLEAAFEEAYAIRAGLLRMKGLDAPGGPTADKPPAPPRGHGKDEPLTDAIIRRDLGPLGPTDEESRRLEEGSFAFCDRVVSHQGVQGPSEALFMGYGLRVIDGMVEHSCVADQASVANAVLDTLAARPDHPRAAGWRACIERWAAWVLQEFATPTGGIGVGILSHKWNPMPEYWCATSLFAVSLFKLARLTGSDQYLRRAMASLDWLAGFDFQNVTIPTFDECAPEVILYASEGIVEGLRFLTETQGRAAANAHPAAEKYRAMARWLVENQGEDGIWPEPVARGYRDYSLGVAGQLIQMDAILGGEGWVGCAKRSLDPILHPSGQRYYGAYVRPWSMSLLWLSLGELALAGRSAAPVAAMPLSV